MRSGYVIRLNDQRMRHMDHQEKSSMKKILGIIASPRRGGNCELMVQEISRHIKIPHQLNLLRLSDFSIKPCRGCYLCLFKKQRCVLRDDLHTIVQALSEADALILTVPTYFLGANASLKTLLDRGLSFYAHADKIWGKPAVGVGIAGIACKEGATLLAIDTFLHLILADTKQTAMVYGALPGEILLNEKNRHTAAEMARNIFGSPCIKTGPVCPVCGGDTFRFLDNARIRCMSCSNSGRFSTEDGHPIFRIKKDAHGLFLSRKEALAHREWLRQEVSRYSEERTRLKQIACTYKNGNRIKPDRCPGNIGSFKSETIDGEK